MAPVCDRFSIDMRLVRMIFVDETTIKIRGRQAWVWVAYEPVRRVFLSFRISYNRSELDAILFFRELRRMYVRKPFWTDDAAWNPEACRWLRLEHHVYPVEWKNLIERMNQMLKDRLENFDDLFPRIKEEECDREHINNWIRVFRFFHNLGTKEEDRPEYQRLIEGLMEELS